MKLNIGVAVVAVLLISFCGKVRSDKDFQAIFEYCKVQENATDADMKLWRSEPNPKPRIVKCLEACTVEKIGLMTNSQINVDAVMKLFAEDKKDEKEIANMKEILNECKGQNAEPEKDRCEASAKVLQCINNGSRKYGMKPMF